MCPANPGYDVQNTGWNGVDMVPPAYGGPGQTLTISLTAGLSVTGSIGGSVEGDAGVIFATVKTSINASISASLTAAITYTGSAKVPGNANYGEEHVGARSQNFNWQYGHYLGNCSWVVSRSGSGHEPFQLPFFWMTTG